MQRHLNRYPREHWYYTPSLTERADRLRTLTLDDVRRCHAELVGASDAELAVVGDFDPNEVTDLARKLFDDWRSPAKYERVPVRIADATPLDQVIKTPDKANAVFRGALKLALRDDDPDFAALVLGNYLFGGAPDSRLNRRVREKEGLSYSVGSGLAASSQDRAGDFLIFAIYAPENRAKVEQTINEELRRVLDEGYSDTEIATGSKGLLEARRVARGQDSTLAARLVANLAIDRTLQWDIEFEARIAALTPQAVREAMRKYLVPERLSLIRAGDFDRTPARAAAK
jgi:zinc protease